MKLHDIKPNDRIVVRGSGYRSKIIHLYTVTRVTKTIIFAQLDGQLSQNHEFKFSRATGYNLPKNQWVPDYIESCNGVKVEP